METERIEVVISECPMAAEEKELSPAGQRAKARREEKKAERNAQKQRKRELRALRRLPEHRRRLRAASALFMAGSLGISAVCAALGRLFGWREAVAELLWPWVGDGLMALLGCVFSFALLYPLWLGMRAYALALWEGKRGAEEGLFAFYTDPRLRRFALLRALRLFGRLGILTLSLAAVLFFGRWVAAELLSSGQEARAAAVSLLTASVSLLLPLLWCLMGQGDALALRVYLSEESFTVSEAHRASRDAMRHKEGKRLWLLGKKLPLAFVGLLPFGLGLVLFSIPDLVWSLALFESQPT